MRPFFRLFACALIVAAPAVANPEARAAAKYGGCVVEGKGGPCQHRYVAGDQLFARFTNRTGAKITYTVAVFRGTTTKDEVFVRSRRARYVDIAPALTAGRYTVRWFVGGAQVAKYRINYVAEGG